jgi:tetrahydromethanopterin S-methyltransferase subunit G
MQLLEMERPMDSWNDERLDELSRRMDTGFKELREEMRAGFARIDKQFEQVATKADIAEVNVRIDRVESRIDRVETRVDRFYFTFLAVIVALVGSGAAQAIWG